MEPPQRRDINELLVNGYFKTSRAKSPSGLTPTTNSPSLSFLSTPDRPTSRDRSRSREPRRRVGPPPPRPTVEDEAVSLSRESSVSSPTPSYDPPLRGIIEQNPIILEADVSAAEAARLHAVPCPKEDDNPERRFVFIPKPDSDDDTASKRREPVDLRRPEPVRKESDNLAPRPHVERRRSRQDLPSLVTKVPRDIPPQFRRSTSAQGPPPTRDCDLTPRPPHARTPGPGESLLSPDVPRGKDYFGGAPRYRDESVGSRNGTPLADKRRSGGIAGGVPRASTPSEKRNSGNFDKPRSRRGTMEKMTRPQQLSEEEYRRSERQGSANSARLSTGSSDHRSGRSSPRSHRRHQSSSESGADSGSERDHRRRHQRHDELLVEDPRRRSSSRSNNRTSVDMQGRYNPPLPSPGLSGGQVPNRGLSPRGDRERAETYPQRSGSRSPGGSRSPVSRPISPFSPADETPRPYDRLNPMDPPTRSRSRHRQAHSISTPSSSVPAAFLAAAVPAGIAMANRTAEPQRLPAFPPYDENRSQPSRSDQNQHWQPPPWQPPSNNLEKPIGTYRRYSEDIERGNIVPLPSCPRTNYVRGRNDWLTLPGAASFDICPSCFNSTIAPTEFRNAFVQAPWRSPETEILCDFGSSPWYRIAWLLTCKERLRDLKLFYGLALIANTLPPCSGKREDIRIWHSLIDPKTRTPVKNFNVCLSCVKSVEILLPALRGIFVKMESRRPLGDPKICDLRFDSKRFIQYFDALETTADQADDEESAPDTRSLVSLAKRFASYPECERSKDLINARWNIITQLPDFTVCEECFEDVVWPELEEGKPIPMMFAKNLRMLPKASCQLYSPKMRGIFRLAVDGDDYKLLASKARERKAVENAFKANVQGVEGMRIEDEWRKWQ